MNAPHQRGILCSIASLLLLLDSATGSALAQTPAPPLDPQVELEEDVYGFAPANNGAGPMWCHGSTCLVRVGESVFASGLETLPYAKPLNNCRWTLFRSAHEKGWEKIAFDATGRTREPCPLAGFSDGRLFLSANPAVDASAYSGPARPELFEFLAGDLSRPAQTLSPLWLGQPQFTEHSYRSFAADGPRGELILFQNIGYTHAEWTFRDSPGRWAKQGQLKWPWGADYEKPQPIRVCYPNVALRNRAVHFCGVSDIIEPKSEWRAYKKQLTGQEWDYDFRRLFYTWTPDVMTGLFQPWIEIASREKTGGWITPGDLWAAPDGAAHLLWNERALDVRLRKQFFPAEKQSHALHYAVVRQGRVLERRTLRSAIEGQSNEIPGRARFHITPDHRLFVFYYVSGSNASGQPVSENRLMELLPGGTPGPERRVPLQKPFTDFYTTTVRAGSPPSKMLELLGTRTGSSTNICYARIRLY